MSDLLHEHDAHQLVGEGHRGEGEFFVGPAEDGLRQPQRAADDEYQVVARSGPVPAQEGREFFRGPVIAVDGQGHHILFRTDPLQDPLPFGLLHAFRGKRFTGN